MVSLQLRNSRPCVNSGITDEVDAEGQQHERDSNSPSAGACTSGSIKNFLSANSFINLPCVMRSALSAAHEHLRVMSHNKAGLF